MIFVSAACKFPTESYQWVSLRWLQCLYSLLTVCITLQTVMQSCKSWRTNKHIACICHSITDCANLLMLYFRLWQVDPGQIYTSVCQPFASSIICSLWVSLNWEFRTFVDWKRNRLSQSRIFWQEILESFRDPEFWYVEQGIAAPDCDGSASFRAAFHRRDEKWWLPVPRVPPGGLHDKTRKQLQHKRDCANQILKAAMAINSNSLAEMEVPESYLDSLPKVYHAFFPDQNTCHVLFPLRVLVPTLNHVASILDFRMEGQP